MWIIEQNAPPMICVILRNAKIWNFNHFEMCPSLSRVNDIIFRTHTRWYFAINFRTISYMQPQRPFFAQTAVRHTVSVPPRTALVPKPFIAIDDSPWLPPLEIWIFQPTMLNYRRVYRFETQAHSIIFHEYVPVNIATTSPYRHQIIKK